MLEGLKRAQRFRLEDQRGTEINFELPDFLKDNNANKWNTMKASTSTGLKDASEMDTQKKVTKAPQPAPRLSISRNTPVDHSISGETIHEDREKTQSTYNYFNQGLYIHIHSSQSQMNARNVLINAISFDLIN